MDRDKSVVFFNYNFSKLACFTQYGILNACNVESYIITD